MGLHWSLGGETCSEYERGKLVDVATSDDDGRRLHWLPWDGDEEADGVKDHDTSYARGGQQSSEGMKRGGR